MTSSLSCCACWPLRPNKRRLLSMLSRQMLLSVASRPSPLTTLWNGLSRSSSTGPALLLCTFCCHREAHCSNTLWRRLSSPGKPWHATRCCSDTCFTANTLKGCCATSGSATRTSISTPYIHPSGRCLDKFQYCKKTSQSRSRFVFTQVCCCIRPPTAHAQLCAEHPVLHDVWGDGAHLARHGKQPENCESLSSAGNHLSWTIWLVLMLTSFPPQASNIDDVLCHHTSFLDNCLKDCMLTNPELLRIFSKLMAVCVMFTNCMQVCCLDAEWQRKQSSKSTISSCLFAAPHFFLQVIVFCFPKMFLLNKQLYSLEVSCLLANTHD